MSLELIFCSGFDFHNTAGLAFDWDNVGTDTKVNTTLGVPRTGIGCLEITSAAFGPSKVFTASDQVMCTTAFNPNGGVPAGTKANIMWLISAATADQQIRVCYEPDLSISVYNGNDPFPLLLGQSAAGVIDTSGYNYITCKAFIHATQGSVQIRVNGVLVLNLQNVKTRVTGSAASVDKWQLLSLSTTTQYHDDSTLWYWTDAADDITGAPLIYCAMPTADVSVAWTPSAGGTNFNLVDEIPQSTVDYVSSAAAGSIDQYTHAIPVLEQVPALPASFTVLGCLHSLLAELDGPGAHTLASDADGDVGAAEALTTSYAYRVTPRTPGPVSSLATLATTPFGPDLVT